MLNIDGFIGKRFKSQYDGELIEVFGGVFYEGQLILYVSKGGRPVHAATIGELTPQEEKSND